MNNNIVLNNFFQEINAFKTGFSELSTQQNSLLEDIKSIKMVLRRSSKLEDSRLKSNSPFSQMLDQLDEMLTRKFHQWDEEIQKTLPMKELSEHFQDKIIFLVFGKVNSGKSSFTNQIVEIYQELFPQETVNRFFINKKGKLEPLQKDRFDEGFTETTAQIQGVELGQNFILLDSPGLHSVKVENGELTKNFVDSADAILWLTPSASPGQVQELDELRNELEKKKPLLPIITRSDLVDEVWSDEKQDFEYILKNKTVENRKLQEDDVAHRLGEYKGIKLAKVKKPISISIHCYKKEGGLNQSGLESLFEKMSELINQARHYKLGKANNQVRIFIQKNVINFLEGKTEQPLKSLIQKIQDEIDNNIIVLNRDKERIASTVKNNTKVNVHSIISRHIQTKNKSAILKELNMQINKHLNEELNLKLKKIGVALGEIYTQLEENKISNFSDKEIEIQKVKGSSVKAGITVAGGLGGMAAGAKAGAALGSVIPGVGTAFGAFVGGVFGLFGGKAVGSSIGDEFIETETVMEVIGTSSEEMESSLNMQIDQEVDVVVSSTIDDVIAQLSPLAIMCNKLNNEIENLLTKFRE